MFIGITILQFRNNPQDTAADVNVIMENCRKNILHIVKEQGDSATNVDCSVFGVLGSYGVAVVWVSVKKGCCLITIGIVNVIKWLIYSNAEELTMKNTLGIVNHVLLPYIYSAVITCYYDEVVEEIQGQIETGMTREEADKKIPVWSKYEQKLTQDLISLVSDVKDVELENNLVYQALRNIIHEKEAIIRKTGQWMTYESSFGMENTEKILHELSRFIDSLVGLIENISSQNKTEVYKERIKSTKLQPDRLVGLGEVLGVSIALSEALCDISMVELSGMDVTIYLLSYVKILKDILKRGDCDVQMQDFVRVGVVIDYFLGFEVSAKEIRKKIEAVRTDFVNSYIGLYYSEHKARTLALKIYLGELESEAEKWMDDLEIWYKQYVATYRIYSCLFHEILLQSSIKEWNGTDIRESRNKFSDLKTVEYYHAVKEYGYGIKSVIMNSKLYSEADKREEIKRLRDDFQKDVFEMNIYVIQKYQKQKSFGDLNEICKTSYHKNQPYIISASNLKNPENLFINRGKFSMSRRDKEKAYEEFRFRADASADQIDKAGYTDCDYLALMQHYGASTIYMDWSESAIQALYFALEAYIDPKNQMSKMMKMQFYMSFIRISTIKREMRL